MSFPRGSLFDFDTANTHTDFHSRYDVQIARIHVESHVFELLTVRDTNALLETIHPHTFTVDERLPYWAELWPSSIGLARYCVEEVSLLGKKVLDLGCGLGLAGIAAAKAGAHVVFADYEADALQFARYNALSNLGAEVVDSRIEFQLVDWRCDTIEPVDLVLGADLVYERRSFLPILNFLRQSLKTNGMAVFADPGRSTGMAFFALAEQEGFRVSLGSRSVKNANKTLDILIGELRRDE